MADAGEKIKKTKSPGKPRAPRATGAKKAATSEAGTAPAANGSPAKAERTIYVPTHDEIAFLALQYWEQRGRSHGGHVQDWLRAEQDLMKMAS